MNRRAFLRIVDANYNRAKEALRVAEDFSRFLLNDRRLTARFKRSRHELTRILLRLPIPYRRLVAARDSVRDVGRSRGIRDRRSPRWQDAMTANLKRAEEALRVLEELARLISPRAARSFEDLRFRIYELERIAFQKF